MAPESGNGSRIGWLQAETSDIRVTEGTVGCRTSMFRSALAERLVGSFKDFALRSGIERHECHVHGRPG